jgi:hypothetical protein
MSPPYITITNFSNNLNTLSLNVRDGLGREMLTKASVTSLYDCHAAQADLFFLERKPDVRSDPVNAWKPRNATDLVSPRALEMM